MHKLVLFVDDEPNILSALKRVFSRTDYQVLLAGNAAQALEIIRKKPVAVLVSDYNMPGVLGADLLAAAAKIRPEMSRIILSGNRDQESAIRSINEGGARKFLTKPWDSVVLIQEVDAAFDAWLETQYSNDIASLFNQATFVADLKQRLNNKADKQYAIVSLQIKGFQSIRQVFQLQQQREFLRCCIFSHHALNNSEVPVGAMDDGKIYLLITADSVDDKLTDTIAEFISEFPHSIEFNNDSYQIGYSVGYALSSQTGIAEEIIRKSFTALNHAVLSGGDIPVAFEAKMEDTTRRRFSMVKHLTSAIANNEFELYYQPKINTDTNNTLQGAEALIRWNSKEMGTVSPLDFIPLAEETDLINEIGQWVMETAFAQWSQWIKLKSTDARVSVNVSPRQLQDHCFADRVARAIESVNLAPGAFELEITESMVMKDINAVVDLLSDIKSLGVKLSIDDFGTGYSSLSLLHRLPIDVIKIDRSFIDPVMKGADSRALVRNLIAMGRDLNMEVVAEGVETVEQLDMLSDIGCNIIQGYYFSPPVPCSEFIKLFDRYPLKENSKDPGYPVDYPVVFRRAG